MLLHRLLQIVILGHMEVVGWPVLVLALDNGPSIGQGSLGPNVNFVGLEGYFGHGQGQGPTTGNVQCQIMGHVFHGALNRGCM